MCLLGIPQPPSEAGTLTLSLIRAHALRQRADRRQSGKSVDNAGRADAGLIGGLRFRPEQFSDFPEVNAGRSAWHSSCCVVSRSTHLEQRP